MSHADAAAMTAVAMIVVLSDECNLSGSFC